MLTIRTRTSIPIMLAVIISLAFPAFAVAATDSFDIQSIESSFDTVPAESSDVLPMVAIHRITESTGYITGNETLTVNASVVPLGGADGHSTALGVRPEQT